jgi:mono/diheme cytochrome c family protein
MGYMFSSRFLLAVFVSGAAWAQTGATVWDGVYTPSQAERGALVYATECARCHRDDLGGYNGALIGNRFMDRWREDSLESFYNLTRNTMPRNAPQSLSEEAYLDVVAYVLKANAFPSGEKELTRTNLPVTRVQAKNGPAPVPDFALVSVIGCLTQGADGTWIVTNASEPVRTRNPKDAGPEEKKELAAKAFGSHTFRLLDPSSVQANPPKGDKVEAKGFLIRKPGDDSLNPTSLQSVAAGPCTPAKQAFGQRFVRGSELQGGGA